MIAREQGMGRRRWPMSWAGTWGNRAAYFCRAAGPNIGELYQRTGRLEMASQHLMQVQNIADGFADYGGLRGDLQLAEGLVFSAWGDWADGEAVFQKAIQVYQKYILPGDEARVSYEWTIALLGNGSNGACNVCARALLGRARSLWEPMEAARYADSCGPGESLSVSNQVVLAPRFAPVRGIGSCFPPTPNGSDGPAIHQGSGPINLVSRPQF